MKVSGVIGLSVIAAVSLSTMAMADEAAKPPKAPKQDMFKQADANADGKLSLDEFKTMFKGPDADKKFVTADADKDGFVTPAELKVARQAANAERQAARQAANAERKAAKQAANTAKCAVVPAVAVPAVPVAPAK